MIGLAAVGAAGQQAQAILGAERRAGKQSRQPAAGGQNGIGRDEQAARKHAVANRGKPVAAPALVAVGQPFAAAVQFAKHRPGP